MMRHAVVGLHIAESLSHSEQQQTEHRTLVRLTKIEAAGVEVRFVKMCRNLDIRGTFDGKYDERVEVDDKRIEGGD